MNIKPSEFFFILFSTLFLSQHIRDLFGRLLLLILQPVFLLESAFMEVVYAKMQRDELLSSKSIVPLRFCDDTSMVYPIRFIGYCDLLKWNNAYYPNFIEISCEERASKSDVIWAKGFVGFVIRSKGKFIEVQTIHSKDLYTYVINNRSGVLGMMRGGIKPRIEYLPYGSDVKAGDTIFLMEHLGVAVGYVKNLYYNPPFMTAEIEPFWKYEIWTRFALLEPLKTYQLP